MHTAQPHAHTPCYCRPCDCIVKVAVVCDSRHFEQRYRNIQKLGLREIENEQISDRARYESPALRHGI